MAASDLSRLVADELAAFFAALDLSRPEAVRDALLEFMPLLVAEYGQVASALSMEWYEQLRLESGQTAAFLVAAPLVASIAPERVEAKVRYLAAQLWTPEPEKILAGLTKASDKYVKQFGRDTIASNAEREGASWARVPTGGKTCAWCLILASRDAVYLSEESALTRADGDRYHGFCDCEAVPIWGPDDYPEGYLPDDYYDMYRAAREAAGSGDMKAISAALRREFPDAVNDGVFGHDH